MKAYTSIFTMLLCVSQLQSMFIVNAFFSCLCPTPKKIERIKMELLEKKYDTVALENTLEDWNFVGQARHEIFHKLLQDLKKIIENGYIDIPSPEFGYVWHYVLQFYGRPEIMPQEEWDTYFKMLLQQTSSGINRKAKLSWQDNCVDVSAEYSPLYILLFGYNNYTNTPFTGPKNLDYMSRLKLSINALKILKEEKVFFEPQQCISIVSSLYDISSKRVGSVFHYLHILHANMPDNALDEITFNKDLDTVEQVLEHLVALGVDTSFRCASSGGYSESSNLEMTNTLMSDWSVKNVYFRERFEKVCCAKNMRLACCIHEHKRLKWLCGVNFEFK